MDYDITLDGETLLHVTFDSNVACPLDHSTTIDPWLRLFDATGNIVADDDDANHNEQDNCYGSKLHLTPEAGTYVLRFRTYQEQVGMDIPNGSGTVTWSTDGYSSNDNDYNHNVIYYYDDDYNDDYDYYRSTHYDDDYDYDDDDPSNYNYRGTAIYHYNHNNPAADDNDNYNYDGPAYHYNDHDAAAHDDNDNNDHAPDYDDGPAYDYDDGPAYDHDDPGTYYDYNFNYRGPYHDPPDNDPLTLF